MSASDLGITVLAVVGYGRWGPNHVRTLGSINDVQLPLICDSSAEARARIDTGAFAGRVAKDLREVCADTQVEGVIVATPAETHAEVAIPLMQAGKHVLIEKPLASDLAQAQAIVQCAREHQVLAHVGHICTYQAGVQHAAELIHSGKIGDLQSLDAQRSSVAPRDPKVDVLWDLAVHDLSILDLWAGRPPERLMATGCRRPDGLLGSAMATLWYPKDVVATLRVSWMDPRKLRHVVAVGSEATLCFDDLDRDAPLRRYNPEQQLPIPVGRGAPLQRELQAFVQAIRQGDPRSTEQQSGFHVIETLTAMHESLRHGGRVLTLS